MLTDDQRKLFSEILNLNWDTNHISDAKIRLKKQMQLIDKKRELKESMGEDAYNDFMQKGRQMFS